jgi:hypothetical protein
MTAAQMAKALVGALIAGLTALGTALADGEVTQGEWVGVAVAALGVLGAVFATPNAADPADPS